MLLSAIDYRHLARFAPVLYAGGLVSLALLFAISGDVRGATRWLKFGTFTFQPSEFMKPLVVLMVARHIQNDSKTEARTLIDLVVPFTIMAVPMVAVMLQPDLGTSLIYLFSTISMMSTARCGVHLVVG